MIASGKTFSSFSVTDIEVAKEFYGNTLGIAIREDEMGVIGLLISGKQAVMLYPKPDHQPATFTVLNFPVEDISKAVDELSAKGVKFEHYKQDGIKTDANGISRGNGGPAIAWFKDPFGNILSVLEMS